jgi:hypothetical protein
MPVTQQPFWVTSDGKPYSSQEEANSAEYELCKKALIDAYIGSSDKTAKSAAYARRIAEEFIDMMQSRGFDIVASAQSLDENEDGH